MLQGVEPQGILRGHELGPEEGCGRIHSRRDHPGRILVVRGAGSIWATLRIKPSLRRRIDPEDLDKASALDADDRRLLIDRGLLGLRHAEVAERLGLTVAVVEKRWQRLRRRLEGESGGGVLVE